MGGKMKPIDCYFEDTVCPFCIETVEKHSDHGYRSELSSYHCQFAEEDAHGVEHCTKLDYFNCPLAEKESAKRYLDVSGAGNFLAEQP